MTLFSKSLALARSTVCLVQGGFDEEAFGASRTLLELALNLRYITNGRNPEARAKRFVDFVAKIKMDWGRKSVEQFSFPASEIRKDLATYKKFRSLERKFPKNNWKIEEWGTSGRGGPQKEAAASSSLRQALAVR